MTKESRLISAAIILTGDQRPKVGMGSSKLARNTSEQINNAIITAVALAKELEARLAQEAGPSVYENRGVETL
jgi:ribosomal protein S5